MNHGGSAMGCKQEQDAGRAPRLYAGYAARDKEAEEEKRELIDALIDAFKYIDSDNHKFKYKIKNNVMPLIEKHTGKTIDEVFK